MTTTASLAEKEGIIIELIIYYGLPRSSIVKLCNIYNWNVDEIKKEVRGVI